jgi:membrane-associated phospholipid phosphatase
MVSKETYQLGCMFTSVFVKSEYLFVGALTQGIAVAFVAAQKIYFQQPRPYFIDPTIPVDCNFIDYGAPSAHTSLAISSWGTIWAISVNSTKAS